MDGLHIAQYIYPLSCGWTWVVSVFLGIVNKAAINILQHICSVKSALLGVCHSLLDAPCLLSRAATSLPVVRSATSAIETSAMATGSGKEQGQNQS